MNEVMINNGVVTNSKVIADSFGKAHRDVIRAIKLLNCNEYFKRNNFYDSFYLSEQNKKIPMVSMTKDGAVLLCMGFTGESASIKKIEFIRMIYGAEIQNVIDAIFNIDIEENGNFIYLARESISGRIKIGVSKNPEKRVKQLNTGNPEIIELIAKYSANEQPYKSEAILHDAFKKTRLHGEWFSKETDVSRLNESLTLA